MAAEAIKKLGKYEIRGTLGKGAMGVVYDGFDPIIERRVAIKAISRESMEAEEAVELLGRLKREAQAAGRLNHPGIVSIYDYGEDEGLAFIAMEYIKGGELKKYFESQDRFDLDDIVRIMSDILDALEHAHRNGVVHRDIKPANIMITEEGRVKVADFGVARIESSMMTQVGTRIGTPAYMSPEQHQGMPVSGRSDVFSAGVILYQFLTGERPFTGGAYTVIQQILKQDPIPPSEINFSIPRALDRVVSKALAKRSEDRYASAREFADALRKATYAPDGVDVVLDEVQHAPPNATGVEATVGTASAGASNVADVTGSTSNIHLEAELEYWKEIKDSTELGDFEVYLQAFPDSRFAALARRRMVKLQAEALKKQKETTVPYYVPKVHIAASQDAQNRLRREAEERAKREAEPLRQQQQERSRQEEQAKAERAAAERAQQSAEEKARIEAEEAATRAAEEKLRLDEIERERGLAQVKARRETEEQKRHEAEERARRELEERRKQEAEENARRDEAERQQQEAESEARRQREEEQRRRQEAEADAQREAEARRQREERERLQAEAEAAERTRAAAEEEAKRAADEKARLEEADRLSKVAEAERHAEEQRSREEQESRQQEAATQAEREAEERAARIAAEEARVKERLGNDVLEATVEMDFSQHVGGTTIPSSRQPAPRAEHGAPHARATQGPAAERPDVAAAAPRIEAAAESQPPRKPRPALPIAAAVVAALIGAGAWLAFTPDSQTTSSPPTVPENRAGEPARVDADEQRRAEEAKRIEDERLQEAEQKRLAQEQQREAEIKKLAETDKLKAEAEAKRLAEDKRKAEEAKKLAEEKRLRQEAARAEEQRKQEAARAEELRRQQEAARAQELRRQQEAARVEEQRKQQAAARLAEEQRKKEEASKAAAEREKEQLALARKKEAEAANAAAPENYNRAMALLRDGKASDAVRILRPLANAGNGQAAKTLGDLYNSGQGVYRDLQEATRYYDIAEKNGITVDRSANVRR